MAIRPNEAGKLSDAEKQLIATLEEKIDEILNDQHDQEHPSDIYIEPSQLTAHHVSPKVKRRLFKIFEDIGWHVRSESSAMNEYYWIFSVYYSGPKD